jgi:hypothetical protein
VYHLKSNLTIIMYYSAQMKLAAGCKTPPPPPPTLKVTISLLLESCICQSCKSCAGVNVMHSQAEHAFILKRYFVSKSSATVHEAFSNAYPDNTIPTGNRIFYGCLSLRGWWTLSAYAVNLFCKFFLTDEN